MRESDGRQQGNGQGTGQGGHGTEQSDQRYAELDVWPLERTIAEIAESNRRAADAAARAVPQLAAAAEAIAAHLERGGRLIYAGAGTSGRLALQDAAELPPTFGFHRAHVLLAGGSNAGSQAREGAEDDAGAAVAEVESLGVDDADAVIGIAASGNTPYTVAAVRAARERGAATVGIANNAESALLAEAEYPVLLSTGPEVLAGSTRLAAGTAQKIALNTLSTAVLVRLGGAYRNLMVGMAQSNEKLRRRAVAMVAQATGLDADGAARALAEAGGSIRVAIVAAGADVGPGRAEELLAANGNRVRDALRAAQEERQ